MLKKIKLLLIALFISLSFSCFGWWDSSHMVIAQIAEENLSAKEKWELEKLINKCALDSTISLDEIIDFAKKNCINEGTLQKNRDYLYVKLNQDYLDQIFNKIKEINPDIRMASFKAEIGPHFSVIRHDEWKEGVRVDIIEIGDKYLFTPKRIDIVQTGHKKLWVLVFEPTPELLALRNKYAIGDLPHGHDFHITIAQQPL